MSRLVNKTAFITGGSRGIGKAIALAFAKEGADLVITYKDNQDQAQSVVEEIKALGQSAYAVQLDICNAEMRQQAVNKAWDWLGNISILVNNAGIMLRKPFLETKEQDYETIFDTHFEGPYFLTQIMTARMIENQIKGRVINISSSRDQGGLPNVSLYAASKSALTTLGSCCALELAEYGITVNTISPGLVKTDMHRDSWEKEPEKWSKKTNEIPLGIAGEGEDIAYAAVYFASDEARYATGSKLVIDGGRGLS